jgi:uncharacterized membrane protein
VVEAEKNEENFKQCEGRVQAVFIANFRKAFLGDGVEGRWVVEAEKNEESFNNAKGKCKRVLLYLYNVCAISKERGSHISSFAEVHCELSSEGQKYIP